MGRKRSWRWEEAEETPDRLAVAKWIGRRRLVEVGPLLKSVAHPEGRSKSWLSAWLRHQAEFSDLEIEEAAQRTRVGLRTLFEGRRLSRLGRAREAAAEASNLASGEDGTG